MLGGPVPFPLRSIDGVLDVALFVAGDPHGPVGVEGAHEAHPGLLHHAARRGVHRHRRGLDAVGAELGEGLVDQRPGALGGVALTPGITSQPVAELRLERPGALARA